MELIKSGTQRRLSVRPSSVRRPSVNNCFKSLLLLQFLNNLNQTWHKVRTLGGAKTVEAGILNFWLSPILGGSKGKNLTYSWKTYLLLQFSSDYDEILHTCRESIYKKTLEPEILIFCLSQILWGAKVQNLPYSLVLLVLYRRDTKLYNKAVT